MRNTNRRRRRPRVPTFWAGQPPPTFPYRNNNGTWSWDWGRGPTPFTGLPAEIQAYVVAEHSWTPLVPNSVTP